MSDPFLKAIRNWVANSSGLNADSEGRGPVIWAKNRAPRPNAPYIALALSGDIEAARDWMVLKEIDEGDPVPAAPGADIDFVMTGPRVEELTIDIFCNDDLWDTVRPERVLRRVLAARSLPSVAQALRAAGIGFGPITPIQSLAIERSTIFEPRARVTIAVHTISEVSERGTWIERAEITPEIKDAGGETVIDDPPFLVPPEEPPP